MRPISLALFIAALFAACAAPPQASTDSATRDSATTSKNAAPNGKLAVGARIDVLGPT